ncbi:MAG: hypothetical protein PF444_00420 [Bacteroidales bacterium]|jgi:AraC family chitin signaling transcriptional activator|nr:hypothetical protein [Bacteroidales bacterium]
MPYETEWSEWRSTIDRKNYTQLSCGNYKFQLQSRLNAGEIEETDIIFIIDKLWYQTWWLALPFLLILGLSITFTIFFMSKRHQQNIKEQRIRYKRKVSEQNEAMKNEQLLQYIEIISHKNEFLNEVREGLVKMRNSDASQWANKINNEVNNEKKEFLFHKLFSELHQDFIVRLTDLYPSLTSNDIRMLSFIRVNLDTREVASLMIISPYRVNANV